MQSMRTTFTKGHKSMERLPKLSSTTSKLFQTKDQLMQSRKILLARLEDKDPVEQPQPEPQQKKIVMKKMRTSFIQFPKSNSKQVFTSFKKINATQSKQILAELPKVRSQSTHLRAFVKAEIVYNKNQLDLIRKMNEQKLKQQRESVLKRLQELAPKKMNREVKIKQKFKDKKKKVTGVILSMNFQVYEHNLQCWKPFVDYDSMPTPFGNSFYFIGGRKQGPIIEYQITSNQWIELPQINGLKTFGDCPSTLIDNKLHFFGGYNYYQLGFSQVANTLKVLDIPNKTYTCSEFNEKKVVPRAYHDQCVFGKYLIISGGLDKDSHYMSKFTTFQIESGFWNELTINQMPDLLKKGFAKHKTLSLFHKRKIYSIYNQEDIEEYDPDITEEGIYLYGGETASGQLNSKMFIVKLGYPSINIVQAKIQGKQPIARRNMAMIRHKQFIIIHGGRNDQMRPFALNSMHLLNLKTMNWMRVQGETPPYRYSHGLSIVNGDIIIMGGKTHQGLSKQVFIMSFQPMIQYI